VKNNTVGMILLVSAGLCCTLGMIAAKLAFAFQMGMLHLGKGGIYPQSPELGWEIAIASMVMAAAGLKMLFRPNALE